MKALLAMCLFVMSSLASQSSHAASTFFQTGAAGACKSALPAYDGNIRTRPLTMQNEGESSAFVTCVDFTDLDNPDFPESVSLFLTNVGAGSVLVTCTVVDGYAGNLENVYLTQTMFVAAGANAETFMIFSPPTGFTTEFQGFSCNLPPAVGIARVEKAYPL